MQVDWRIGTILIVAVVAILLIAALAGPGRGLDRAGDSGGPPGCPPGHVTTQGCTKP